MPFIEQKTDSCLNRSPNLETRRDYIVAAVPVAFVVNLEQIPQLAAQADS
jgi:hypothetical protein